MKNTVASFVLIAYGFTLGLLLSPAVAKPATRDWLFLLLGAGIAWALSHYYHLVAARGARQQLLFQDTILRAMERQFGLRLARDVRGNLTGGELVSGTVATTLDGASASLRGSMSSQQNNAR
jgi:hypothetical protein